MTNPTTPAGGQPGAQFQPQPGPYGAYPQAG